MDDGQRTTDNHTWTESMVPVTAAIILDQRGRVLLAQRPENDLLPLKWEFPGGKLRDGESPEACLRRELQEELGIIVEVRDVFHVVHHPYAGFSVLLMAYLCEWIGGEIHLQAHCAYRWVQPSQLLELDLAAADRPIARKLSQSCSGRMGCKQNAHDFQREGQGLEIR